MKYLESCVKTRYILRGQLAKIAPLANVNIRVNIPTAKGSSHDDYVVDKDLPWLKIVIVHNHFMLNESLTNPFFGKSKCNIVRAVNILFEKGLLEPIPDDKLTETFVPKDETNFSLLARPKVVPDKVLVQKKYTVPQGVGMFGYQPEPEELPMRLQELQDAINKLPLRHPIDVKLYWRASELGQKVLYETGCFDDVYEITGEVSQKIRDSLEFPQTGPIGCDKFDSDEKIYYVDLNAAYMRFVQYIPTGIPNEDGEFPGRNYTVGKVIQQLYDIRKASNPKLAMTLKLLMNSTWGYSIKKPQEMKSKHY
ncbi:DNA/RNA polymerases family, partial [Trichomonas vaginalis G3]